MGPTREKKKSKRSAKAQGVAEQLGSLSLADQPSITPEPSGKSHLQVHTPSTTTSQGSLRSHSSRTTLSNSSPTSDCGDVPPAAAVYDPDVFEVQHTSDKGFAVFSTRRIAAGTLVLSEKPLIRLTSADEAAGDDHAETILQGAFADLSRPEQKAYYALHDSHKAGFTLVKSIYYSNCYNLDVRSVDGGSCIGLVASRMNHGCIPNVQVSFDDASKQMRFHAIRPIPRGKEILSNYNTVFETRAQRQRKQVLYYGFRCDCEACVPASEFWERSDERRVEMMVLRKDVKKAEKRWEEQQMTLEELGEVLEKLRRMESTMVREGLMGDCLVNVYKSLAKWTARAEKNEEALQWKLRQRDCSVMCWGRDSAKVLAMDRIM